MKEKITRGEFLKGITEELKQNHSDVRSWSKGKTFKLSYGGFPDVDKGGTITQEIFDNYHNKLYPGITNYRENYVLPTVKKQGYIHCGLGFRMYCDDAEKWLRTLNNATCQFWSILTLIAINELNYRIKEAGLEDRMDVQSTIYDSIYVDVDNDQEVIKWLNDNMIEIMCVQYLKDEQVHNTAEGEISDSWANMIGLSNNASVEEITKAINKIKER